jgi:hypothetical protein
LRYLRGVGALAIGGLMSGCGAPTTPTTADVDAIRAAPDEPGEGATSAPTTLTTPTSNRPTPTARFTPSWMSSDDPIDALRAIANAVERRTRPLATMLVPHATVAHDVRRLFATTGRSRYELQSNDGVRANVFVLHRNGRAVVTLVRWEGEWLIGAVVALQTEAPFVVVGP